MLVWRVVKGLPWRRPGNSHWPLAFHAFPTLVGNASSIYLSANNGNSLLIETGGRIPHSEPSV